MYQYPSQPQSIDKVLQSSLKLYAFTFRQVIAFALVAAVITALPEFVIPELNARDPKIVIQAIETYVWLFRVVMVPSLVFYNAIYYRMDNAVRDPSKDYAHALAVGVKKTLPVVAALILCGLVVGLGLMLALVPGIFLGVSLVFCQPIIVLGQEGIGGALKSSFRLVWGNWWRTFAVFLVFSMAVMAVFMIMGFLFGFAVVPHENPEAASSLLLSLVGIVTSAVMTPLFSALVLVQLNDLNLRRRDQEREKRFMERATGSMK